MLFMNYDEEDIIKRRYYEIKVDNDTENKFRIFVEERTVRDKYYDCGWHPITKEYYYEISSGENVNSHFSHESDDERKLYIPYDAINSSFHKFYRIYSLSVIGDDDFDEWESIKYDNFKKIEEDTKKGKPYWGKFFSFEEGEMHEVSATELSNYLKELVKAGKENEYAEYVKNLVLDLQKKYIDVLSSYYKKAKSLDKEYKSKEEQVEQAKSFISSFSKRIKN